MAGQSTSDPNRMENYIISQLVHEEGKNPNDAITIHTLCDWINLSRGRIKAIWRIVIVLIPDYYNSNVGGAILFW